VEVVPLACDVRQHASFTGIWVLTVWTKGAQLNLATYFPPIRNQHDHYYT